MKVWIKEDEYWPWLLVYTAEQGYYGFEADVPKAVVDAYLAAQRQLEAAREALVEASGYGQ